MQTPYTVPEIARITGIPETTLYDYVRQFTGIVPEMDPADENGRTRRRYPEQAIAVFQTIRHLKDRGVDLPTIRALLQEGTPPREITPSDQDIEPVRLIEEATGPEIEEAPAGVLAAATPPSEASGPESAQAQTIDDTSSTESAVVASVVSEVSGEELSAEPVQDAVVSELPTTELVQEALTVTAPSSTEALPDVVALQGQLLGSLEEGLLSLRDLLSTQNAENSRLREELKKEREALQQERDENAALRADLTGQKDQTRSAERLLALIKNHCEEGIQSISN